MSTNTKTIREVIFAHRNSEEITSIPMSNAHQMQSVIMRRKDAEYVKFLMSYVKLPPRILTQDVTSMLLKFLGEKYSPKYANTGYVNTVLRRKIDFAFELAFNDSSTVNLEESNVKNNLMATYLDLMINQYERELGSTYTHVVSTISSEDDIEDVPEEFEIYDFLGEYTCISRETEETTKMILKTVLNSLNKNEAA